MAAMAGDGGGGWLSNLHARAMVWCKERSGDISDNFIDSLRAEREREREEDRSKRRRRQALTRLEVDTER